MIFMISRASELRIRAYVRDRCCFAKLPCHVAHEVRRDRAVKDWRRSRFRVRDEGGSGDSSFSKSAASLVEGDCQRDQR